MDNSATETTAILQRILGESGSSNLLSILENLTPTDFHSLLLEVFKRRVAQQSPSEVLAAYIRKYHLLGTSELNQREILAFNLLFLETIPAHIEAVEFSPIGPLGANGVLTKISQNNILSASRSAEIMSDPTVALAFEAAKRRKELLTHNPKDQTRVHLTTTHRLLRMQQFDPALHFMQHFRCFGMCSAGRDVGHEEFLIDTARQHIKAYLDFLRVARAKDFSINEVEVYLSDIRILENIVASGAIKKEVVMKNTQTPGFDLFAECGINTPSVVDKMSHCNRELFSEYSAEKSRELLEKLDNILLGPLREEYPHVHFAFDLGRTAGIGYYTDFCFHVYAKNKNGLRLPLVDGGLTDWTQKLLQNNKEMLMVTGFGADLAQKMFRR